MSTKGFRSYFLLFTVSICASVQALAQPSERTISRNEYIEMWKDEAISQMVKYNIPASITLAQGILESANGNSELAKYANNHFGIKCYGGWTGETINKDDDQKDDCFRKYLTADESFEDHSVFLQKSRYQFLYEYDITDYEAWAKGLKKAGYATNPKYPELLINLIEQHELYKYDKMQAEFDSKDPILASEPAITQPLEIEASSMVNVHMTELSNNKIKFVTVKKGDTYYKIAKEFDLGLWQLYKYNELTKEDVLMPGDIIYLQPKKNKAKEKVHVVQKGETMKDISQMYGVKVKKLYKHNEGVFGKDLEEGQQINLK
ncbi:MAG: glucosaminidase domain-containing protein [Flavobacteriales bacterium]|nr:glucosaminidase domain-containing protein [Flavobacteriales bacterium]